jgi:lipopolysaccharide transport system ATP-binding protein
MGDVAREGRTVLFVSHNMPAVQALCNRAILLRQGTVALDADVSDVLREYLGYLHNPVSNVFRDNPERSGDGSVRLTGGRVLDDRGRVVERLIAGAPATFELLYENPAKVDRIEVLATIINHLGISVTHLNTGISGFAVRGLGSKGAISCQIPNLPLPRGEYRVAVAVKRGGNTADHIPNALTFSVESSTFFGTGKLPPIQHSACLVAHEWNLRPEAGEASVEVPATKSSGAH